MASESDSMYDLRGYSVPDPNADETGVSARRIVVGMSGGVDSSVTAALLQRDGWEVVGVTCDFVLQDSSCCDARDAHAVCDVLGIRHIHRDATPRFETTVIRPFCEAYANGLTPSPCPNCNAAMKLPELFAVAEEVGATHVATGHYARVVHTEQGRFAPQVAADTRKDQSYMLARLSQEQLSRLVLPLGEYTKPRVRAIAEELALPVAARPDSEDLCFAPDGYRALLAERGITCAPGPIVDTAGHVLGMHTGITDYTIGQRSGLGIGGAPEPYFVMEKDAAANTLTVGFAAQARMVGALITGVIWQAAPMPPTELHCSVKLRYRSTPAACIMSADSAGDVIRVTLDAPQALTAPGQFAVFYDGKTVLGSGMIARVIRVGDTE